MSDKYKFHDPAGVYFVTFTTLHWIDVFIREEYISLLLNAIRYCQIHKGLRLLCWCLMPSHMHMIYIAENGNPGGIIKSIKGYTSRQLLDFIPSNVQESRRVWMMRMFRISGKGNDSSRLVKRQFWQFGSHPILLWSPEITRQKMDYIHNNPVKAGLVEQPEHWRLSSAIDYAGGKGLLEVHLELGLGSGTI